MAILTFSIVCLRVVLGKPADRRLTLESSEFSISQVGREEGLVLDGDGEGEDSGRWRKLKDKGAVPAQSEIQAVAIDPQIAFFVVVPPPPWRACVLSWFCI